MSNQAYYERWLQIKQQFQKNLSADLVIQELAKKSIGVKPQAQAIEVVARVYCKYCEFYNKLCDCYDQMEQAQRRPYIRNLIDALTCRILEIKRMFENVEAFEFTYPENALQQLLIVPDDIQIMCPFFYPFEIRSKEMQYIIDEIISGNRIGDPKLSPSEILRREELRLEEERIREEEKEAEIKRKIAMGDEIVLSEPSIILSPAELESKRFLKEYATHINNIQRMARALHVTRERVKKFNKDANLFLELTGSKAPTPKESVKTRAAALIQRMYRKFMEIKREHYREKRLREKIGMVIPSWSPPSAKFQWEKVKQERRKFREKYYEKWLSENVKEKSRVLRLREGDIMEDISSELRAWMEDWYKGVRQFDEFPWPGEGGSILIVRGETFTIEEYLDWCVLEEKRLKAEAGNPKSKDQIKAEKIAARQEKKRIALQNKEKERKAFEDYKKSRMKPENDPGVLMTVGQNIDQLLETWNFYQTQWKDIDRPGANLDVTRGHIMQLITDTAYQDVHLQLRPIVDEMMRLELNLLKKSLKNDYEAAGVDKVPLVKKRKKPRNVKSPKPPKITPAAMFQQLYDQGIILKYPRTSLDEFWGDRNFAAADTRAIPWVPTFSPPCIGDVKEQVRIRCLLALGSNCPNAERSQLIVGPRGSGKRALVYAIASETNAIIIDLSPLNVYDKFPGPKNLKTMFTFINRISRVMAPTIILVDGVEKLFYKKVPKEEKLLDPIRLQKDFYKEIVKPLKPEDKILVLGTATEPWLAKPAQMQKAFPSLILLPRTDYGSLSVILTHMLMKFHGVKRDINVHSVAQTMRGFDVNTLRSAVAQLMSGDRIPRLYHQPLDPMELLCYVLDFEGRCFTSELDYDMYRQWYLSYSPWGEKYRDYMAMLDSQLQFKLKADKKRGGG